MNELTGRRILLIIAGGIAAYKSLDLIRKIKDAGAQVRCVLTDGGAQFVTPLSVAALSGEPVFQNMFAPEEEQRLGHIKLSRETDLIVVAPAMNCAMWQHPATQANMDILRARGILQVGPASGSLACGEEGAGRMSEPLDILEAIKAHFAVDGPLKGKRALVTSGPTYEPVDPVRFIGNRSSGKQGHAIAKALAALGADVTLVTGPVALADPEGVKTIHIETAREMLHACQNNGAFDIAICAAAVADWRPAQECDEKIKKDGGAAPTLNLTENPDILATLSQSGTARPKLVIGFAAETEKMAENAAAKFARKGCDWLVANDVGGGKTFGSDDNEVTLLRRDAEGAITQTNWPRASKDEIARKLADDIAAFFH